MLRQITFVLLLVLIGMTACTNENILDLKERATDPNTTSAVSRNRLPENTISLATFNEWNKNWETHWDDQRIAYFTMPLSNLQNLVNTPGVDAARLYLGYSEEDEAAHLTLVGVDATGASMLGLNDYIYNVTTPCPSSCGDDPSAHPIVPSPGLTQTPAHTISESTFNTWNTNWETRWDDNYIKYFTMPLSNLQNLVNTNGVAAARFYMGYSEVDAYPHLTLVGVNVGGQSMLGTNAHIYNFARPCPVYCN